jgi:hypothetical protein
VAGASVAGASVATIGASVVGASVAGAPHADSTSPSTVMNENSVTNFFMALLLLFDSNLLMTMGMIHPISLLIIETGILKGLPKNRIFLSLNWINR